MMSSCVRLSFRPSHAGIIYNNPSVNLATGVAYVDGRTGEGRAAGADAGGGRGRTTFADRLRARANGERGLRRAAKPQWIVAWLWLVPLILTLSTNITINKTTDLHEI